jgi:hypothetical protein
MDEVNNINVLGSIPQVAQESKGAEIAATS